jgi:hypothetical protein
MALPSPIKIARRNTSVVQILVQVLWISLEIEYSPLSKNIRRNHDARCRLWKMNQNHTTLSSCIDLYETVNPMVQDMSLEQIQHIEDILCRSSPFR